MNSIVSVMMLASVLVPAKAWYAPNEPINIHVKPPAGEVTLVLTDFTNASSAATSRSSSRTRRRST
jgi:hypothetical protein